MFINLSENHGIWYDSVSFSSFRLHRDVGASQISTDISRRAGWHEKLLELYELRGPLVDGEWTRLDHFHSVHRHGRLWRKLHSD